MKKCDIKDFNRAKNFMNQGNYGVALKILEKLYNFSDHDLIISFDYAKCLIKSNSNYILGEKILKDLSKTSNNKFALFELGKYYLDISKYEQAKKCFSKILHIYKQDDYALLELGRVEAKMGNYITARKYFENLLETDSVTLALLELGKLEFDNNNLEKAKEYFLKCNSAQNKKYALLELGRIAVRQGDFILAREYFNKYLLEDKYILELIYLDIKENKLNEAYEKICTISTADNNNICNKARQYLEYKLGLTNSLTSCYFNNQLINFSEEKTIKHMKLHLHNKENRYNSYFSDEIDLDELYYDIKNKIKDMNTNVFTVVDKYIINYDYPIGISNGKAVNNVEVVTFINTKDIITIFPIESINNDIEFLDESNEEEYYYSSPKVKKRESQIDKFKRRYQIS